MKIITPVNPQLLASAVLLLRPSIPELTGESLIECISKSKVEEIQQKKVYLTIAQYSKKYGICVMTVRRALDRGELNTERIGKRCIRIVEEV